MPEEEIKPAPGAAPTSASSSRSQRRNPGAEDRPHLQENRRGHPAKGASPRNFVEFARRMTAERGLFVTPASNPASKFACWRRALALECACAGMPSNLRPPKRARQLEEICVQASVSPL